jgi:hypothetical protein
MCKLVQFIVISAILAVFGQSDAMAGGHLNEELAMAVRQNLTDLSKYAGSYELESVYELCARALNGEIAEGDLVKLRDLAEGREDVATNQGEHFWRSAANFALYNQDGDADRLVLLSRHENKAVRQSALAVLKKIEPAFRMGRILHDREMLARRAEFND